MDNNIQETFLPSGLHIVSEKVEHAPAFALGITIKAGAADCTPDKQGLAHNLEHLIFRRAANGETKAIAEKFESLGAYVNAFTTHESTMFYVRAMNDNFQLIFMLLSELLIKAEFDKKSNAKERKVILEEVSASEDEPEEYIFDQADNFMFKKHPFGYSILGDEKTLDNISIEDLKDFYNQYYCLSNAVVTVVGNIDHDLITCLSDKLLTLSVGIKKKSYVEEVDYSLEDMVQKLKMPIKQTHLVCGSFFTNANRKKASLASVIVADGMSSRLYQEVRENLGLAYSVYSSLQQYSQCGVFYIYAAFSGKRKKDILDALECEFALLQSEGITYEEYSRAIEMVKTGYAIDMEDLSTRATRLSKYATFNTPLKSIEEDIIAYQSISYDELNEYIKKQFAWRLWKQIILGKK